MAIFKTDRLPRDLDLAHVMPWVARTQGLGFGRQTAQILRLLLGPSGVPVQDYYKLGLFRPEKAATAAVEYIGRKANRRFNTALSPTATGHWALLNDKLLTGLVLNGSGFRTPRNLVVYAATGPVPGLPSLSSVADVAQYLRRVDLPIFGKPTDGSLGIGAASFMARTDAGLIQLGDGRTFSPEAIAAEIARFFPRGFLFQALVRQHPDIEALAGLAVGTLRVVTLWEDDGPRVLYCVFKLPAKGAMTDGSAETSSAFALVDPGSGKILRTQDVLQMCLSSTAVAPATGATLVDVTLPLVPQAVAMCEAAHRLFPTHGLLGYDVMLAPDGPLIGEINTNPFHILYQRAADRGVMNPDFAPRVAKANACLAARLALRATSVANGAKRSGRMRRKAGLLDWLRRR